MKPRSKVLLAISICFIAIVAWFLGFLMGNTTATRRSAISSLSADVWIYKELERGDVEKATERAEFFVATRHRFLQSEPFWLRALQDELNVDEDEIYARVATKAEAVAKDVLDPSKP